MVLPQIAFAANYEEDIKSRIFAAMDCRLESNKRFNHEFRWFSEYPEFVLKAEPTFHNPSKIEISRDFGKYFEMSIARINGLYQKIRELFPEGFTSYHKTTYPIDIHQVFRLGSHVWASVDKQSVFFCAPPILGSEYDEWKQLAVTHDFTYMMSDSRNAYAAGREAEQRMAQLKEKLDHKVCVLWYNYVLGRMRLRPQDGSFGMHTKDEWNTVEEAYKEFSISPTHHPYVEPGIPLVNTPCYGFPPHPKKEGWRPGDWNTEYMYSGSRELTHEEFLESLKETVAK